MSSANHKWWESENHISDPITSTNLSSVVDCWNDWRAKGYRLYFRGEGDCLGPNGPFPLQPGLVRRPTYDRLMNRWKETATTCDLERKIFERYKRHSMHLIEEDAAFVSGDMRPLGTLCLSQHFSLPTRLLDWTLNPLVALYFALTGEGRFSQNSPSRIWVMVLKEPPVRDDRTIHLESSENLPEDSHLHDLIDLRFLDTSSYPDKKRKNLTKGPYIVVPLVFTRRIAAQSGRFLYCPNLMSPDDRLDSCITKHDFNTVHLSDNLPVKNYRINKKTGNFVKIRSGTPNRDSIPWERLICYPIDHVTPPRNTAMFKSMKEELLHQLEFRGFHAGKLFPDLSGWARYLNQGFK